MADHVDTEEPRGGVSRRDALRITATTGLAAAFGGGVTLNVLRQLGLRRVSETRERMGTVVTLTVVHPDADAAHATISAAFAEIDRLEAIFSRHRGDSALGRLNATGALVDAPRELTDVLGRARQISEASSGAFDVTVLPLVRLYEESFARRGRAPQADEIDDARARVGFDAVEVRDSGIRLGRPGMAVSLDGIAKGFIVDRTLEGMVAAGAERVLVNAGGDMAAGGAGSLRDPWTIGLQDPNDPRDVLGLVRLGGAAVATSGDYMQAFSEDRRFHHIVDPRTGFSPPETSSVNVVAGSAADADALSTALMVLGPIEGCALLEATPGAEGMIVTKEGIQMASTGMSHYTS